MKQGRCARCTGHESDFNLKSSFKQVKGRYSDSLLLISPSHPPVGGQ